MRALVEAGARVIVLDNFQAGRPENLLGVAERVDIITGDVRNRAALASVFERTRPSAIFHLAANASVPGSVEDPLYDYESNASGTFFLLDIVRASGLKPRILVASSGAVYGEPTAFPLTESSPLQPISPYGFSKLYAEHTARMFHRVYGQDVVVARIFNSYGPRMPRYVMLDFLRKLAADSSRLEILGTGAQVRDFTYASDTAAGLMTILAEGVSSEAYNLSSGTYYSVNQLAEMMLHELGLEGTEIHHTGSSWVGDAQRWEVSIAKLRALGYAPNVPLKEGLRETIRWFEATRQRIARPKAGSQASRA